MRYEWLVEYADRVRSELCSFLAKSTNDQPPSEVIVMVHTDSPLVLAKITSIGGCRVMSSPYCQPGHVYYMAADPLAALQDGRPITLGRQ